MFCRIFCRIFCRHFWQCAEISMGQDMVRRPWRSPLCKYSYMDKHDLPFCILAQTAMDRNFRICAQSDSGLGGCTVLSRENPGWFLEVFGGYVGGWGEGM